MNTKQILQKSRPLATESTIQSYLRLLEKLKIVPELALFPAFDKVIADFKLLKLSYLTERNYLNALIVFAQGIGVKADVLDTYQKYRDELNTKYTDQQSTGELSEKQKKNWVSMVQIEKLISQLNIRVKSFPVTGPLDNSTLLTIQELFMLRFWTVYPLRNDLYETKVITKRQFNALNNDQKVNTNYLVNDSKKPFLSLGRYKTVKTYGIKQIFISDPGVRKIMTRWLKVNPLPYVLVKIPKSGPITEPMTSLGITNTFLKIFKIHFDKKFSTTMLRHVVLTESFSETKDEMARYSNIMGHSTKTANDIYIKQLR